MSSMSSLEEILDGSGELVPDLQAAESEKGDNQEAAPPAAEPTETEVKPEPEAPEPQAEETEQPQVPYAALKAERERLKEERQSWQARQADLERQLGQAQGMLYAAQPQQQAPEKKTDFYSDPEGWTQRLVESRIAPVRDEAFERGLLAEQQALRVAFDDYDKAVEVFKKDAEGNPSLLQGLRASKTPAADAYKYGKQRLVVADSGEEVARLKKEIEELKAKRGEEPAESAAANVVPSNAGARGAGVATPQPKGHLSLTEIVGSGADKKPR